MTDPRAALRSGYAQWLRLRADVRALAASLVAAEHALRRDARRNADDADLVTLVAQIGAERKAIDVLAAELDTRITRVKADCDMVEAGYVEMVGAAARRRLESG